MLSAGKRVTDGKMPKKVYHSLENIVSSLQFDSDTVIAEVDCQYGKVILEVRGDVKIAYSENCDPDDYIVYTRPSQFPQTLKNLITGEEAPYDEDGCAEDCWINDERISRNGPLAWNHFEIYYDSEEKYGFKIEFPYLWFDDILDDEDVAGKTDKQLIAFMTEYAHKADYTYTYCLAENEIHKRIMETNTSRVMKNLKWPYWFKETSIRVLMDEATRCDNAPSRLAELYAAATIPERVIIDKALKATFGKSYYELLEESMLYKAAAKKRY